MTPNFEINFAYNANGTIFEGKPENPFVKKFYDKNYPSLLKDYAEGVLGAREKEISTTSELADYLTENNIVLKVINDSRNGLQYLKELGVDVKIISAGNQKYIDYNVKTNTLDDLISKAISSDEKDKTCKENSIDVYVSHKPGDLIKLKGVVKYFIMVDESEKRRIETIEGGTKLFLVKDLGEKSMKWVYNKIKDYEKIEDKNGN